MRKQNIDLGKTSITEDLRVSSAAIYYDMGYFEYYQFETFIFSSTERIKTRLIIHGSSPWISKRLIDKTKRAHNHISDNLIKLVFKN